MLEELSSDARDLLTVRGLGCLSSNSFVAALHLTFALCSSHRTDGRARLRRISSVLHLAQQAIDGLLLRLHLNPLQEILASHRTKAQYPADMALPSAQIAEDFRDALEDLSTNDRHQIQTLAGLANENSEHALAISREIEKHIRGATPGKKLPALYLLDSLVKNYGKPYSDILSRNLFTIFMEAYQRVDDNVRRSMEALAKTWKVPVANSGDTKPVFPPDVTRQIDLALGQARAAYATQQSRTPQPPFAPPRPPNMGGPWGHTATPPQHDLRFQPPATYGQAYGAAPGFPPQPPQQVRHSPPLCI